MGYGNDKSCDAKRRKLLVGGAASALASLAPESVPAINCVLDKAPRREVDYVVVCDETNNVPGSEQLNVDLYLFTRTV